MKDKIKKMELGKKSGPIFFDKEKVISEVVAKREPNGNLQIQVYVIESFLNRYSTYREIEQAIIEKIVEDLDKEIEETKTKLKNQFKDYFDNYENTNKAVVRESGVAGAAVQD